MNTKVTEFLDSLAVEYTVKVHAEAALTCETAAQQRGVRVSQIVKCMVGRDDKAQFVVMLLPGDRTLKIKKVRQLLGGKVDLVPPDELARELDVTVGAISPIQFVGKARIIMDPSVFEEEVVDISSGDPLAGVELRSATLRDIIGGEVQDIISTRA